MAPHTGRSGRVDVDEGVPMMLSSPRGEEGPARFLPRRCRDPAPRSRLESLQQVREFGHERGIGVQAPFFNALRSAAWVSLILRVGPHNPPRLPAPLPALRACAPGPLSAPCPPPSQPSCPLRPAREPERRRRQRRPRLPNVNPSLHLLAIQPISSVDAVDCSAKGRRLQIRHPVMDGHGPSEPAPA